MPAYNEDGTPFQPDDPNLYTPLAMIYYVDDETKTNRILANVESKVLAYEMVVKKVEGKTDRP